jgi:predicted phage terminase large subunit-like protein
MAHPLLERTLKDLRAKRKLQIKEQCEADLYAFVKHFWHIIEPSNPMIEGWVMEAICQHLQAVNEGIIRRIIINVPPGCSKSLLSCVFFPAWEWGPRNMPSTRYAAFSYTSTLTERDNGRLMHLMENELYQEYWGDRVKVSGGKVKVENDHTGWKLATSISGVGTGERADRLLIDDLNNVKEAESRAILDATNQWIREVMPTRLNHLARSSIIAIQQRTSEEDCTGTLLDGRSDWCWLVIPMRYEPDRHCTTEIGWTDPRTIKDEFCWPERFPPDEVEKLEREMGSYAVAGQLQQRPSPRGGGLIKDDWWKTWERKHTPGMNFIIAALDTAATEKDGSDYTALVIFGCWEDGGNIVGDENGGYDFIVSSDPNDDDGRKSAIVAAVPKILMVYAWQERLDLPATVKKVIESCLRYKVDLLVIENKSRGHDVNNEIKRMLAEKPFSIAMSNPTSDKWARLVSVQNLFEEGLIYAPGSWNEDGIWEWKEWADTVIRQVSSFPRVKNDDLVDCVSMGLQTLRKRGFAPRKEEVVSDIMRGLRHKPRRGALYDA